MRPISRLKAAGFTCIGLWPNAETIDLPFTDAQCSRAYPSNGSVWRIRIRANQKVREKFWFNLNAFFSKIAKRFPGKAGCYISAIKELKEEGTCPKDTIHRQVKYLNNVVEANHGKLKRLIKPTFGSYAWVQADENRLCYHQGIWSDAGFEKRPGVCFSNTERYHGRSLSCRTGLHSTLGHVSWLKHSNIIGKILKNRPHKKQDTAISRSCKIFATEPINSYSIFHTKIYFNLT